MMKEQTLHLGSQSRGFQLAPTLMILLASALLPFLIHLIPFGTGTPVGPAFLPIFYLPFIALVFFKRHVALIAAALAPFINFLLTGSPQWEFVTLLSVELVAFVLIASHLLKNRSLKWVAAPIGYLLAKLISCLILLVLPLLPAIAPLDFTLQALTMAVPGILILTVINLIVLKYKK